MKARSYLLFFFFTVLCMSVNAQISGTVFRDFNANGTKDNSASFNEIGLSGISVMAFNSAGAQVGGTQTTNASGDYSFSGLTLPVRVEFSNLPSGYFSSVSGATNVQFVSAPSSNINFAAHNPYEYCQNQPKIATICYVSNAPNVPTSSETILWGDLSDFLSASPNTSGNFMPHNSLASQAQTGSVYGMAYHKHTKQILVSTFAKMGTNIGSMGADGIYKLNPSNGTVTPFLNLSSISGGASAGTISTPPIVGQIGKNGLGDLELSEDGTTLYTINLANRRLYSIPIGVGATVPASIVGFDIPTPSGAVASDLAPFALAVKDGKVYIGMVNTAASSLSATVDTYTDSNANGLRETNGTNFTFSNVALGVNPGEPFTDNDGNGIYNKGNAANLRAYVYEFDPSTSTFSLKLDFPLNYPRTFLVQNSGNFLTFAHSFIPWDDNQIQQLSSGFVPPSTIVVRYLEGQQPWLTDITFDGDDMVLGFRSRTADIVSSSSTTLGGEILRACNTGTNTWSLESNGICGGVDQKPYPAVSVWANNTAPNTQGPGNGEWYWEDDGWEGEASQGSLSYIDGYSYVLSSMMDGLQNEAHQGFYGFDNTTGGVTGARNLFIGSPSNNTDPTAFGKSNGLGALEPICDLPPIEIGNRVWTDTDNDGIQDAGEAAISGVTVQLLQGSTVIATATTDANGNYYFSNNTGTSTASAIYGITQLEPNMAYTVRIPNVQGGSKQAVLGVNTLTTANVGGAGQPDVRDSDGTLVGNNAEVTVMTTDIPTAGANNHTFDFGFAAITCVTPTATAASTNPTCAGATAQNNGTITLSGTASGQRYQFSSGVTFNSGSAIPASITTVPAGGVIVNNLSNTTQQYTVRIYDATDNACFVDRTVSITAVSCGDCSCTEYVYVNERENGTVHKFRVEADGSLTEINPSGPWYPNGQATQLPNPHGLGSDLNGFLYIAEDWDDPSADIRKLKCDGTLLPESEFQLNGQAFNITSVGNKILYNQPGGGTGTDSYALDYTSIEGYDVCTEMSIGEACFLDAIGNQVSTRWGFWQAYDGSLWAYAIDGGDFIYKFTVDDIGSGTCITPLVSAAPGAIFNLNRTQVRGITTDSDGNIYLVNSNAFGGSGKVTKLNQSGMILAETPIDAVGGDGGYYGMVGLIYVESCDCLYSANYTTVDDCVTKFSLDLQTITTVVGPTGGNPSNNTGPIGGKAIGRIKECCPNVSELTFNETVCSGGNGERVFLQNLFSCGDGIVCEGTWTEFSNTSGGAITYNECDLSITINGSGCATYKLTSAGGTNASCNPFTITVNVCTEVPAATVSASPGTCTGSTANNDVVINVTGAINADQAGISTGATYTGPAYNGTGTVAISGGTATITGRMHNTQYTVRVFNGSNDCFVDYTVTTPMNTCTPTGDCNCKEYLYLNDTGLGEVHKFAVNADGSITEIGSPWMSGFANPHGLGSDLNGYLYIGDDPTNGPIKKVTCDGQVIDATWNTTIVGGGLTNIGSIGNYIFVNGANMNADFNKIHVLDACLGDVLGSICFNGTDGTDWGMQVLPDGTILVSHGLTLPAFPGFTPKKVFWKFQFNESMINGACIDPLISSEMAAGSYLNAYREIWGVTTDGTHLYAIAYDNSNNTILLKINATTGAFVAQQIEGGLNGSGYQGARGLVYAPTSNRLYVAGFEDCLSIVNPADLSYIGPGNGVIVDPNSEPKAIGIVKECCPNVSTLDFNETVCSSGNGEKFFLQDFISCGDGIICEGMWSVETPNGNQVFNTCDLSITVNGSGCGTYVLEKTTGATGNQQCSAFRIEVTICTEVPAATVSASPGTCTGSTANNDAVINITAATNANQTGISTGATYTGPVYNGAGTVAITGGIAAFTGRMHNTQYTVRIFNGSNDCFVDYTITTPTVTCCALAVTCTPQPQTNCSPINGSASVSVTGAVGTVTYLWSSGETTNSINNKAAGIYTVTVTDGGVSGCTRTCEAVIANQANAPTCTITVNTQPSCANLTGGNITVVPSPAGTYTYAWSDNGAATATRTGLTGGTYTVTVTNTTTNCTGVCNVTLDTPMNCCNINAVVPQNLECIDNGTPALLTDNRIRFSASVTNTNTSLTGYNVTINGGTTITPNTNVAYGVTQFLLGPGTAGGGATFTVTVTDSATPGCTQTFQVIDPGTCTPATPECPPVQCGTATIQVNGN